MPKFQVSYMAEGKPDRQYLHFEHPSEYMEPQDVLRAIVKAEYPNEPDPFPAGKNVKRDDVLHKYKLSELKTPSLDTDEETAS